MIKQTDYAYIAGILDGEGSISITNQFYLDVKIRNTNKTVLEWIQNLTPARGHIYADKRRVLFCYSLQFSSKQALLLLKPLMPYLKIKKRQALLAFKFLQRLRGQTSGTPLTDNERQKRKIAYHKMKELNQSKQLYNDA